MCRGWGGVINYKYLIIKRSGILFDLVDSFEYYPMKHAGMISYTPHKKDKHAYRISVWAISVGEDPFEQLAKSWKEILHWITKKSYDKRR
jgi:hypothetical protein